MKKFVLSLILAFVLGQVWTTLSMADSLTPNYRLTKPSRGSSNWDTKINANMDSIDAALAGVYTYFGVSPVYVNAGLSDHGDSSVEHTVAWAIDQLGNNGTIIVQDGNFTFGTDLSIPAGFKLVINSGAVFKPSSGKTLTFAAGSSVDAGPYKIFGGEGSIVFGAGVSPILGDWFGGDLYKAYNSTTSSSVVTYYSDQYVTQTIVTKGLSDVSIDGGNGKAYKVIPHASFTEGDYLFQIGEWGVWGAVFKVLSNMNIDCSVGGLGVTKWANGVETRSVGFGATLENLTIGYAKEWAVFVNNDVADDNITNYTHQDPPLDIPITMNLQNTPTFRNIITGQPGTGCFKARQRDNAQGSIPIIIDKWYCVTFEGAGVDGFLLDANNTSSMPLAFDIHDLFISGEGSGHGLKSIGQVHLAWSGGAVEQCGTNAELTELYCKQWNADYASIYIVKGSSEVGADFKLDRVQMQTMPYVDGYSTMLCSNCDPNYQIDLHGTVQRWGKVTDYTHAGPPNFPYSSVLEAQKTVPAWWSAEWRGYGTSNPVLKYNTGTVRTDGYGVRWSADHGGAITDNSTGWRALDFPIKVPFTYDDFDGGKINLWYPTEGFAITKLDVWAYGWDCTPDSTTISFGTLDDNEYFMEAFAPEGLLFSMPSRYYWSPWVMASQRCIAGTPNTCPGASYPDLTASGRYNYIDVYLSGGTCSAGNGLAMIYGVFLGEVPGGSTP